MKKITTKFISAIALPLLIAGCSSFQTEQSEQHSSSWNDNYLYKKPNATVQPYNASASYSAGPQERHNYKAPAQYHVNEQDEQKFSHINDRIQQHKQKMQEAKEGSTNTTTTQTNQNNPPSSGTTAPSNAPATYTPSNTSTTAS